MGVGAGGATGREAGSAVTTTANSNVFGTQTTGMYNHEFIIAASDPADAKYMGFRKHIPGTNATNSLGETYTDGKIVALTVALPNDGIVSARVDTLCRVPAFDDNPSFTYSNTQFEEWNSIPISCVLDGFMKVPTFSTTEELPIVGATWVHTNAPLDIRQEKVYGDPYLEDITVIARATTVDLLLKWKDPRLYLSILTGTTTGTQWSSTPWTGTLDIVTLATKNVPASNPATPWQLRLRAAEMMYQVVGGIRLAGNQSVMMRITGTAIIPSSGNYLTVNLANATTQYIWPT